MIPRLLRSKIFSILMAAVAVALLFSLTKLVLQRSALEKQIGDLENKISIVEKGNQYLEKLLASLENPAFLEREARARLNYKAADEEVAFVYRDINKKSSQSLDFGIYLSSLPNYKKWFYYLMGK